MALASPYPLLALPVKKTKHQTSTSVLVTNSNPVITLLRSCSSINEFRPIHSYLITTNLIRDPQISTHVLEFLVFTGNLDYAQQIIRQGHEPEIKIWNSIVENQLKNGYPQEVFAIYLYLVTRSVLLNVSTFHFLIHACSRMLAPQQGSEVHGRILKYGLSGNLSLNNNLMGLYKKSGKLKEVSHLFDKLPNRDVISWNTMISCYSSMGMYREGFGLLSKMTAEGVSPDEVTMVSLVSACTKLRDLEMGEKLHLFIEESCMKISGSLLNGLVDMYVKCGKIGQAQKLLGRCEVDEVDVVLWTTLASGYVKSNEIDEARRLFDKMMERNLISWTVMISGYAQCGYYFESLKLFREMRLENLRPDEVVLLAALSACVDVAECQFGRSIHGLIVKYGMIVEGFLVNALINLYVKFGQVDEA